jgi:drug/metabolite transporter (DMT)-like permease
MQGNLLQILGIYALTCMIWGSTWLAIRIGLESIPPIISAGYRFTLASILIFGVVSLRKIKIQTDEMAVRLYLAMAFFSFIIPYGLIYWAEQFVPSGLTAILYAVYPFSIAIFSFFMIPSEKIGINKIIGIIISFTGLYLIFSESFTGNINNYIIGLAAVLISAVMQSAVAVSIKKYGHHLHPLSMNFYPMLIAGVVLTAFGFITERQLRIIYDYKAVFSVFYLALFGSLITFTSYYWLIKRVNIIIVSLITFITPIIALFLGWFFYSEQLSVHQLAGCLLVLIGLLAAIFGNIGGYLIKNDKYNSN